VAAFGIVEDLAIGARLRRAERSARGIEIGVGKPGRVVAEVLNRAVERIHVVPSGNLLGWNVDVPMWRQRLLGAKADLIAIEDVG